MYDSNMDHHGDCNMDQWSILHTMVMTIWTSGPYYKTLVHIRVHILNAKTCQQQFDILFFRGRWTVDELSQAMSAYRNGDMGLNASAKAYGVPKATLKRHLYGSNKHANREIKKLGRQQVLPLHVEEELVKHLVAMENMFFGVTRKELMKLAYEVAEKNDIPHGFNRIAKMAGKTWYRKFMLRHPEISLRQPEATSVARASGFNNEAVGRYFTLLEKIIDEHKLTAMRIYNMDESGISVVQKSCQKVIGLKGKHQIGSISSAERGINTTVVCCNNAAGQYVPPQRDNTSHHS